MSSLGLLCKLSEHKCFVGLRTRMLLVGLMVMMMERDM
jgi:hypothetical protein